MRNFVDPATRARDESGNILASKAIRYTLVGTFAVVAGLGIAALAARLTTDDEMARPLGLATKEGEDVRSIGPNRGDVLGDDRQARAEALAKAEGPRLAVVSLRAYATVEEARKVLGGGSGPEIVTLLAAPPGGGPVPLQGDMRAWVDAQKEAARKEREGFEGMLADSTGEDKRQFEEDIRRLRGLVDRLKPTTPVVFAAVVRADAQRLRDLAGSPGVAFVDIGTSARAVPEAQYRGVRPEETTKAGTPDYRPL